MAVMIFLSSLTSKFDMAKSQILSSPEISSVRETFSQLLRTEISPSIQMSSALVSKNSNYELVKQQTKSSGLTLKSRDNPRGEWYVIIVISQDVHIESVGSG